MKNSYFKYTYKIIFERTYFFMKKEYTFKDFAKKYSDSNPGNNIKISKNLKLSVDYEKTHHNSNFLIIGGGGSGVRRNYVIPNLLNPLNNTSYVCLDMGGEIVNETKESLELNGYTINIFDLSKPLESKSYNPLDYIKSANDVLFFVKTVLTYSVDSSDSFWINAEHKMLLAFMLLLINHGAELNLNRDIETLVNLIRNFNTDEVMEEKKVFTGSAKYFEAIKHYGDKDITNYYYKQCLLAAGRALKSVWISVNAKLDSFNTAYQAVAVYTKNNRKIDLNSVLKPKTVLFINLPMSHNTYNILANIMLSQIFNIIMSTGPNKSNNNIRFVLPHIDVLSKIRELEEIFPVHKSYNISFDIIVPNLKILKNIPAPFTDYCDSLLYYGCSSYETNEYVSKLLGTKKDLTSFISPEELQGLDTNKCIYQLCGVPYFCDDKY